MTKKSTYLIIYCALTCLWTATAIATVDDFDDGDHNQSWFISHGATLVSLPYTDNDHTYQRSFTYRIWVDNTLIDDHCKDSDGTKYKHYHFLDDYTDWSLQDKADDYWDYIFQTDTHCERQTGSHATVRYNCFPYALADFIATGVYNQWMLPADALNALNADADSKTKTTVQACDVIAYGALGTSFLYHMTGVDDVDTGAHKPEPPEMEVWL